MGIGFALVAHGILLAGDDQRWRQPSELLKRGLQRGDGELLVLSCWLDAAIRRLLDLCRDTDPKMQAVREAADDAPAEILSLKTGIEDV